MAKRTPGITETQDGRWRIDKTYQGTRLQGRFETYQAAENWLLTEIEQVRQAKYHRPRYRFEPIAAKYLLENEEKLSIQTEATLLEAIMPFIGHLNLEQIHDDTLQSFIKARKEQGRKNKTINASMAVTRHILNLSARKWRDDQGRTLLETAPLISMLPLDDARKPRPISWIEQRKLLPELPVHLQPMALFDLNTGARDDVVCNLRWEWEVYLEELECSVFIVPPRYVKGRKGWRPLVCNRVAQSILDSQRGKHPEFVFTYQRGKNHEPHAVETMNNNGWQKARKIVGLQDVRVHDLRHTVGMRLREAGVREETISDLLWHSRGTMTAHYSVVQVRELLDALNLITDESNRTNASLEMLFREKAESLQSSFKRKMG
ncbi:MAG: tyrosine-type recombinase/integrase [Gallionella sp.]